MHDKQAIRRAYESGESLASITARFGCALSTIYRAIGKQRRRKFDPPPVLLAKIPELVAAGLGHKDIARALGLGRHRVLAEMRRAAPLPKREELERENDELRAALEAAGVA